MSNQNSDWDLVTAETYFFLALRQYRMPSLINEKLTTFYCDKLNEERVLETIETLPIVLNVCGFRDFLANGRIDLELFERNHHKFRAFMNEADDVLF